jgi:mRNA-degrading endonuclease YafQ of YafQ-DinJ toxin-antitoxin module
MIIYFTKSFSKKYWRLPEVTRKRVDNAIGIFRKNPLDPILRNHPLKGDMKGRRSLSAGFDLRLIFEERDGYTVVIMIAVGKHEEVY